MKNIGYNIIIVTTQISDSSQSTHEVFAGLLHYYVSVQKEHHKHNLMFSITLASLLAEACINITFVMVNTLPFHAGLLE